MVAKKAKAGKATQKLAKGEASAAKNESSAAKNETPPEIEQPRSIMLYVIIAFAALIVIAGLMLVMSPPGRSDAEVSGSAIAAASDAMTLSENSNGFVILRTQGLISKNESYYLVSFPIIESEEYSAFDVMLDSELNLKYMGLDGKMKTPQAFVASQTVISANALQECARQFNEQFVVAQLISENYNKTSRIRAIYDAPKTLNCDGTDYPYSLEIGDGYAKTTINGSYTKSGFTKGIVTTETRIPESAIFGGVYIYVDVVGPGKLALSFQSIKDSPVAYDAYNANLIFDFKLDQINRFPALVWNCKDVVTATLATAELNGTVARGTEELMLKKFACMFNNGEPQELCGPLGIVRGENGTINIDIPTSYALNIARTGLESCRPEDGVVRVDAFYPLNCSDCINQRLILDRVAAEFGDSIELTYYCVGMREDCQPLLKSTYF
jgi:hypothetical protein